MASRNGVGAFPRPGMGIDSPFALSNAGSGFTPRPLDATENGGKSARIPALAGARRAQSARRILKFAAIYDIRALAP